MPTTGLALCLFLWLQI